jgi:hypothetical protein
VGKSGCGEYINLREEVTGGRRIVCEKEIQTSCSLHNIIGKLNQIL